MSLDDRQEHAGCQQALLRVLPADERLHADQLAAAHVHLGLVVEFELVLRQRLADALQALVPPAGIAVEFGIEEMVSAFAGHLRQVHRLVGLAQQLVGILLFGLREEGHPEAGRNAQHQVVDAYRPGDCLEQALKQLLALGGSGVIYQYRNEFIPAQARDGVALAQCLLHTHGHGLQQLVADLVSVLVVDRFESVQVQIDHSQLALTAMRLRHGLFEAVGQQDPVGQVGQCIVVGDVFEFLLVLLLPGDIDRDAAQRIDLAVVVAQGKLGGLVYRGAAAVRQGVGFLLQMQGLALGQHPQVVPVDFRRGLRIEELFIALSDDLLHICVPQLAYGAIREQVAPFRVLQIDIGVHVVQDVA